MSRRKLYAGLIAVVMVLVGVGWFASRATLSALEPPGRAETYLATRAKHFLVGRASRGLIVPPPAADGMSEMRGEMNYGARCRACHGTDGRTPTDIGRAMYPPAPDLGSPAVQQYTDAELFVVIHDGIRLTGMPGFAKIHSDAEIWDLVRYVRSLGEKASPAR